MFGELASTLYCWVSRLHERLRKDGVEHVFFLSREGQPLKRMFDAYRDHANGTVRTHYLEVSRRSTLLPSLGPLDGEEFETLFRQYRRISLAEFLASLGLEDSADALADALGLDRDALHQRSVDFPKSTIFSSLRALPLFRDLYEQQRNMQRTAFIDYLTTLADGRIPRRLAVVDVGWKGTIQDNLHRLLCTGEAPVVDEVKGYYIGLIGTGAAGPDNIKDGVLFTSIGTVSRGFQVFNENKSLFEVVLAADHGSVVGYGRDAAGRARPVHGPFEEQEMLQQFVFPVQQDIEQRFRQLLQRYGATPAKEPSIEAVARAHARMVFNPTQPERVWFDSVFHVENFGFFERSRFGNIAARYSLRERLHFIATVLRRRNVGELGFWPWATLHQRAGALPAMAYAAVRRWQSQKGRP